MCKNEQIGHSLRNLDFLKRLNYPKWVFTNPRHCTRNELQFKRVPKYHMKCLIEVIASPNSLTLPNSKSKTIFHTSELSGSIFEGLLWECLMSLLSRMDFCDR